MFQEPRSEKRSEQKTSKKAANIPKITTKIEKKATNAENSKATEENPPCVYCSELFYNSRKNEQWIQCLECLSWAHVKCTEDGNVRDDFICLSCA